MSDPEDPFITSYEEPEVFQEPEPEVVSEPAEDYEERIMEGLIGTMNQSEDED